VSINVSQIFVRYPEEKDPATLLAAWQGRAPSVSSFLVARTGTAWLAVCAGDNAPSPDVAKHLSRALEASVIWFGLAGNALAYRMIRYELGKESDKVLEPPEIFQPDISPILPAYKDVEAELYAKLRGHGIPAEYVFLFMEEIGVSGGAPGMSDAAVVRNSSVESFVHRVPRRSSDTVRTLFDHHQEGEHTVFESLRLQGSFDHARARQLLQTLQTICKRRSLPAEWKARYRLDPSTDPDLAMRLFAVHAAGKYAYEIVKPDE
jgi:hypothetical protein